MAPAPALTIVGVGVDLVAVGEFEGVLARRGERFVARVFRDAEIAYCRQRPRPAEHFAARFAAKEAAFKALGTGWSGGIDWRDVEVVGPPSETPRLELHAEFRARAFALGARRALVSLTHAGDYASAVVMLAAE